MYLTVINYAVSCFRVMAHKNCSGLDLLLGQFHDLFLVHCRHLWKNVMIEGFLAQLE